MPTFDCEGTALWYESSGEGELLIALHGGLGLDHTYFRPWLDPLSEHLNLTYLDFRANGRSAGEGDDLTMRRLAEDVDALRRHLGHPRTWLLGHSYGGFVALEYAVRFPDELHGLVLMDTDSTAPSEDTMVAGLGRLGVKPEEMAVFGTRVETDADLLGLFDVAGPWYLPHSEPTAARAVLGATRYRPGGSEGGDRALRGWDVTDRLPDITAPTLVVTGVDDFMFPPDRAARLAAALPAATAQVVADSGHLPFVERTEEVLDLVMEFVRGRDGGTSRQAVPEGSR